MAVAKSEEPIPSAEAQLQIKRIGRKTIELPIVGTSPLIVHNFSEKSKRQMLESMQGIKSPKKIRDPEADYESGFYRIETAKGEKQRYGFPALGFKAATIGAARYYGKDVKMTELKQFLFFEGVLTPADNQPLVEIFGEPTMREDIVRLAGPTRPADLRYRPQFENWTATLRILFVDNCISLDSVLALVDAGGLGVGVGEWRAEKKGLFGSFTIDDSREMKVIG